MFIVVTYLDFVKSLYFRDSKYICEIVFDYQSAKDIESKNSLSRAYRLYNDNIQDILKQYNKDMQEVLKDHVTL